MPKKTTIAYLAPEMPALSATFIYNEVLGLEKKGFSVFPLSVHVPNSPAKEDDVDDLADRTHYLYQESLWLFFISNLRMMGIHPIRYMKALFCAVSDSFTVGLINRVGIGLFYRFFAASRIADIILKKKCQHLHSNFAHVPTDIAMYASMISGIPFSFTSHANDLFERGWLLKEKVKRSVGAVTISEYNKRFLITHGAPEEKIHVIHCGVNSDSFITRGDKALDEIPKFGTLGRMVEKKGFDILVQACGLLRDKGINFHLEIAGDGPLKKALEDMVKTHNLSTKIRFSGALSHDQVSDWIKSLDLFILPCREDQKGDMDGIPVVLMEAMLCGVAVISTKLSGIPELIEDEKTGSLVAPNNPGELAHAINTLLSDQALRKSLIENAIQKVRWEFDVSKNIDKLAELFKESVNEPTK